METKPEYTRDQTFINLQRNPILGLPAMHSMPLAYAVVDDQQFFSTLTSSSAAHPQPSLYYQGDGGGGFPRVLDGALTAQAANNHNMIPGEPAKRKRGRPKKYGPNGTLLAPSPPTASMSFSGVSNAAPSGSADAPKKRGRPLGSGKRQQMNARGSSGMELVLHFITVPAGEDVVSKIASFSQQGSHSVYILSANGVVSNANLFQPATTGGGIVAYQGPLEILSLSGTFSLPLPADKTEQQRQTRGLTVSLANKDGGVIGGGLAGLLLAASPVQLVVGSFIPDGTDESKRANAALNFASGAIGNTGSNLPTRGASIESSGPPMQNTDPFDYIGSLEEAMPWK